jgi:membrane protein YdbS with pleckstrin-like domain
MSENSPTSESSPHAGSSEESLLWKGSSSAWRMLGVFTLCFLLCWLVVPIFIALWKYWENRCRFFELTTQRIRLTNGIFTKVSEEIELYRIEDIKVVQPFWYRLFGLGSIMLTTNDASAPTFTIDAIPDVIELREHLRKSVEQCRDRKRVRLMEME